MEPVSLFALSALALGARGDAIANLHALLDRFGGADISADERRDHVYGRSTQGAVTRLLRTLRIAGPDTGIDDKTARAINEAALGRGIFFLVAGKIAGTDGAPAANVPISVFDADNASGLAVATAATDADGRYGAFYDPHFFRADRPGTRRKEQVDVVVEAGRGEAHVRSDVFRRPPAKLQLDLRLPGAPEPRPEPPREGLRVRGQIVDGAGAPVRGSAVGAFDYDIGDNREPLGAQGVLTDAEGRFVITYQKPEFAAGEGTIGGVARADLVFSVSLNGQPLTIDGIVRLPVDGDAIITAPIPAGPDDLAFGISKPTRDDELVRIVVSGIAAPKEPSVYDRLMTALEPLTARRALVDFDEEKTRDVRFAARETGWPFDQVSAMVAAHKLAGAAFSGTEPRVLYAIARHCGARDARAIATKTSAALADGLHRAVAANTIADLPGDATTIARSLAESARRAALDVRDAAGSNTLAELLSPMLADAGQRAVLMSAIVEERDEAAVWRRFSAAAPGVAVEPIKFALELGAVTRNHAPLAEAFKRIAPQATSLRTLAFDLDGAKIAQGIEQSGALPGDRLDGEDDAAARVRYSQEINALLEATQPTSVAARIARVVATDHPDRVMQATATAFERAVRTTDFDLATGSVDDLVAEKGDHLFEGVNDPAARAAAHEGFNRIQRLYRVSPDPTTLSKMLSATSSQGKPFRGAVEVAQLSRGAFLSRFTSLTDEVREGLSQLHAQATASADLMARMLINERQMVNADAPSAAKKDVRFEPDPGDAEVGAQPQQAEAMPSWADFFGGSDMCDLDEARSLVGQCAYLVDLFQFARKRCHPSKVDSRTPFDVLCEIRPDLQHIKLTSANTYTTIPTIDLINEILESIIANNRIDARESSPGVTGSELLAAPEHIQEAAYDQLGREVFPILLPYDRRMATVRAALAQAGIGRNALILKFSSAPEKALAAAAETLGLLARDVEILTGKTLGGSPVAPLDPPAILFGQAPDAAGWESDAAMVRALLKAFGIPLADLIALIRTRFIGGEVPEGNGNDIASRLLIGVDALKTLREANYVPTEQSTIDALALGGLTAEDVKAYFEPRAGRLSSIWAIDPPIGCAVDQMIVRHLDASALAAGELLVAHRFVRLAKRAGMSFEALDQALSGISGTDRPEFTADLLVRLAELKLLKERFDLSWPVAASLVGKMSTAGPTSLYAELFVRSGLARLHAAFRPDDVGNVLTAAEDITPRAPILAAALQVEVNTVSTLLAALGLTTLDLESVGALHRVVVLARLASIDPPALLELAKALGMPSFKTSIAPAAVDTLMTRVVALTEAGFSDDVVARLTGDRPSKSAPDVALKNLETALAPLAQQEAQDAQQDAAAAPPLSDAERDDRTKAKQSRQAAARERRVIVIRGFLAAAFGLDPSIIAALTEDTQDAGGQARAAILRAGTAPAMALLSDVVPFENAAEVPAVRAEKTKNAEAILLGLERITLLVTTAGLNPDTFAVAVEDGALLPGSLLASLAATPDRVALAAALDGITTFAMLSRTIPRPAALATAITAIAAIEGSWTEAACAAVAALLDRRVETVTAATTIPAAALAPATAKKAPVAALAVLQDRIRAAGRIATEPDRVADFLVEPITLPLVGDLMDRVRSRYGASSWLDVVKQMSDPIRQASRDALVASLLHREKLKDETQLFSRCLVDVGINPFVQTSRVRQATFATQVFFQRGLMGLLRHLGVSPDQIPVDEWRLIRSFRPWSAREMAFLYPEHLLDPSWRDDKGPAFRKFEDNLRQADPTPPNGARALGELVDHYAEVGSLQVCGTFLQTTDTGQYQSILHVVGRTRSGMGRRYFYRRLNRYTNSSEWTDWIRVEADIQGIEQDRPAGRSASNPEPLYEPGVHILPIIVHGVLHLFWPTFLRKVEQPVGSQSIKSQDGNLEVGGPTNPYWEIKLCWTRLDGENWSARQQSAAVAETYLPQTTIGPSSIGLSYSLAHFPAPSSLVLKADLAADGATTTIIIAERQADNTTVALHAFTFSRSPGEMRATHVSAPQSGDHVTLSGISSAYMGFAGLGELRVIGSDVRPDGDRLFTAPVPYKLVTLNQAYGSPREAPFFISTEDRAYFVETTPAFVRTDAYGKGSDHLWVDFAKSGPTVTSNVDDAAISEAATILKGETQPWIAAKLPGLRRVYAARLQSSPPSFNSKGGRASLASVGGPAIQRDMASIGKAVATTKQYETVNVSVKPFWHPFAHDFVRTMKRSGMEALLAPENQRKTLEQTQTFKGSWNPDPDRATTPDSEGVDFDLSSAFGKANWDIFYFALMSLQQRLADNGQLEASIDICHLVFNPLDIGVDPNSAWRFEGLRTVAPQLLDEMLAALQNPADDPARKAVEAQIEMMRLYPFQAHRIARLRPIAYKKWTAMQYVRRRIEMCKQRYRQFTPESVNYCQQDLMIAAAIMGPKPEIVPPRTTMKPMSYAEVCDKLDALGNVVFAAESKLAPATAMAAPSGAPSPAVNMMARASIGYFGIPKDEKLLALWDEIADLLYKLRNGMTIDGVQVQLPLFPPPIDPALLAAAVAAGLDIAAVVDGLSAPPPTQRFRATHRQAVELAEMVVRIGQALSDSREKADAEDLVRKRSVHEVAMAKRLIEVRRQELAEAELAVASAERERDGPLTRWKHFAELLGLDPGKAPGLRIEAGRPVLDSDGSAYQPQHPRRPLILVDADTVNFDKLSTIPGLAILAGATLDTALAGAAGSNAPGIAANTPLSQGTSEGGLVGGKILGEEKQELEYSFENVRKTFESTNLENLASVLQLIPNFEAAAKPFGAGMGVHMGGMFIAAALSAEARNKRAHGGMDAFVSSIYGKQAAFVLREREWISGLNAAAADILHADRAWVIAEAVRQTKQKLHDNEQAAQKESEEIAAFLREKFTNKELHDFRIRKQLKLFGGFLALAIERAKMAERCFQIERRRATSNFITIAKSDDAREELLVGHQLLLGLAELERAYLAGAAHGPELTRTISLRQIAPFALFELREKGTATFDIPDVLFDLDHPGHYDRRLRSVQISIPCITGPSAPVTGTLTLVESKAKRAPGASAALETDPATGAPFIALSSGRDDSGMFELSLQDDAYLPFEVRGAASSWKLRLGANFHHRTIANVMLTFHYIASDGGEAQAAAVTQRIKDGINALKQQGDRTGAFALLNLRSDFPDIWTSLLAGASQPVTLPITSEVLAYPLRHGFKPNLTVVSAADLPTGKVASAFVDAEPPIATGQGSWTVKLKPIENPQSLDDVCILAGFRME